MGVSHCYQVGRVSVACNALNREFSPTAPNRVWVTGIKYIRTYEGWLYLAAVMDLYSRQIVGWACVCQCRPSPRLIASQVSSFIDI